MSDFICRDRRVEKENKGSGREEGGRCSRGWIEACRPCQAPGPVQSAVSKQFFLPLHPGPSYLLTRDANVSTGDHFSKELWDTIIVRKYFVLSSFLVSLHCSRNTDLKKKICFKMIVKQNTQKKTPEPAMMVHTSNPSTPEA